MGKKILTIESATEVCSAALFDDDKLLYLKESAEGNRHSQWMTSYVMDCLTNTGMEMSDIDAIAVSAGPGSYTGLRVGYATAKGLCYQLDIPLIEVNTLRSNALRFMEQESIAENSVVIPMMDARRMEVYQQIFDSEGKSLTDIEAVILTGNTWDSFAERNQIYCIGNGAHKVLKLTDISPDIQSKIIVNSLYVNTAQNLITETLEKYESNELSDVTYSIPFYLKSPNITQSKKALF